MPSQKVLEEILLKLNKIEKETKQILRDEERILKEILHEEKEIKKEEKIIKKEEDIIKVEEVKISEKEKEIESILQKKLVKRKYEDIILWKNKIWENCTNKLNKEEDKEVTYFCKKLQKHCNFTTCPLNFI